MKILLLGGFLGSGKTTFLLQLAKYLTEHTEVKRKYQVIIIENEVGEIGIDQGLLGGYQVENLFSGCACCTLSGELAVMVKTIKNTYDPNWLIIEASGVALPESIKRKLETEQQDPVLTLVLEDAGRWERIRLPLEQVLVPQVEAADMIYLNKVDLVTEEQLHHIVNDLKKINPTADVYPVSALKGIKEEVFSRLMEGKKDE